MPVFVCEDRVHGAQRLLQADNTIDTIVLDDAYQHRFIHRDINILLTDYHRLYSRDCVLPEGRLRELPEGAARADIIVVSKCPYGITPDEALNGTTALHAVALMKGAAILRVHDVKEAVQTIRLYEMLSPKS